MGEKKNKEKEEENHLAFTDLRDCESVYKSCVQHSSASCYKSREVQGSTH